MIISDTRPEIGLRARPVTALDGRISDGQLKRLWEKCGFVLAVVRHRGRVCAALLDDEGETSLPPRAFLAIIIDLIPSM